MVYNTGETSEELKEKYNPEGSLLRKAQMRMFDMLLYLDKVCKELHIDYQLDGGTVLGAVRHGGFIPWDDDIDVGFERKKWKRLVRYLETHPHPQYKIQTHRTDPGYMGAWAVLRDTKSEYIVNSKEHNIRKYRGVQVDLFPFDQGNVFLLQRAAVQLDEKLIRFWFDKSLFVARLGYNLCYRLIFPIFRLFNVFGKKKFLSHSYGTTAFRLMRPLDVMLPAKELVFEGVTFMGPAKPKEYLKNMYGDYMSLPPIEQRNHHRAECKIWD